MNANIWQVWNNNIFIPLHSLPANQHHFHSTFLLPSFHYEVVQTKPQQSIIFEVKGSLPQSHTLTSYWWVALLTWENKYSTKCSSIVYFSEQRQFFPLCSLAWHRCTFRWPSKTLTSITSTVAKPLCQFISPHWVRAKMCAHGSVQCSIWQIFHSSPANTATVRVQSQQIDMHIYCSKGSTSLG